MNSFFGEIIEHNVSSEEQSHGKSYTFPAVALPLREMASRASPQPWERSRGGTLNPNPHLSWKAQQIAAGTLAVFRSDLQVGLRISKLTYEKWIYKKF